MNFKDLGLRDELVDVCKRLCWEYPTDIQRCSIPVALEGKDIIGKAETGGGKTGAFGLPILNEWLNNDKPVMYALILIPTRELGAQIQQQILLLGGDFGLETMLLTGSEEMSEQMVELGKWNKHVVIATPGRLVALLAASKTARSMLETIRHLVIDEADRMLQLEFGADVDTIAKYLPKRNSIANMEKLTKGKIDFVRQTQLFSATFCKGIKKIAGYLLYQPQQVFVDNHMQIPASLTQYCLVIPYFDKASSLFALLRHYLAKEKDASASDEIRSAMIFVSTCKYTIPLANYLNKLGPSVVALHSDMSKTQREAAIEDFRSGAANVLVATDIASRGIDVDHVKLVVNYDLPQSVDWYKHRVGRTARAGREGTAVTIVTDINKKEYLGMENNLNLGQLPAHPTLKLTAKEKVWAQRCFLDAKKEVRAKEEENKIMPDNDFCYVRTNFATKRKKIDEKTNKHNK